MDFVSIVTKTTEHPLLRHRMQTKYIMFLVIVPILLEGCCVGNHQKKQTGLQQSTTNHHYRAVEGEMFIMPCLMEEAVWLKTGEGRGGNEHTSFDCKKAFPAEAKHSGKYTCLKWSLLSSGSKLSLSLRVVKSNSVQCFKSEDSSKELVRNQGGKVSCPGLNCHDDTDVIWYKGNVAMSKKKNSHSREEDGRLHFSTVREPHAGVYFCDRKIIEDGVNWTIRRAVNITVVPYITLSYFRIMYPDGNKTEDVELGGSHTLTCEVFFPVKSSPEVKWYMHYGGNMENMTVLHMEELQQERMTFNEFKVTRRAIITEVTPQHLNNTYTCIANNAFNISSVTIKLKKRIKVKWPSLVGYPIVSLLLVAGMGIVLHVKWLELQLLYRSYFPHEKCDEDEKEFDVFLSYVWSPTSADVGGVLTLSSQPGPGTDEEAYLSSMNPLDSEEANATLRPPEVLLPQVLEDQWGYRLCLLERDVLPGGAYTNDVALAIQRSQMLICLLSDDYLSNSNAVFVLESGVQALLQNSTFKLLLIWTVKESASLIQTDPPLPTLVKRALKVLPSLDWTSGKPARANKNFWKSLRKAMPDHRVKQVSLMYDRVV